MTAATNRRNRRATTRSRRRACSQRAADRLTTMQVGGTTGTMSWFSRGAMRNQYETGAIKATYSYTDINNNLRVAHDAAGLTTSTYDGDNLRRKVVSGSVTSTFVWDGADYLQIKPSSGDPTLLVVLDGEVVGHVKGSEKRDYIVDPLGSVVAYLNSSQTLTDQFEYWPYGELITEVETEVQPFLWVGSLGYFRDSDLRTYIRAREYRQDLGSWMQLDPLWPSELPYIYGSPISDTDPSGLARKWPLKLCQDRLEKYKGCLADLEKEFAKYNPWTDQLGGFPKRGGGLTVPFGHRKEITDLQKCILNALKDIYDHCGGHMPMLSIPPVAFRYPMRIRSRPKLGRQLPKLSSPQPQCLCPVAGAISEWFLLLHPREGGLPIAAAVSCNQRLRSWPRVVRPLLDLMSDPTRGFWGVF